MLAVVGPVKYDRCSIGSHRAVSWKKEVSWGGIGQQSMVCRLHGTKPRQGQIHPPQSIKRSGHDGVAGRTIGSGY